MRTQAGRLSKFNYPKWAIPGSQKGPIFKITNGFCSCWMRDNILVMARKLQGCYDKKFSTRRQPRLCLWHINCHQCEIGQRRINNAVSICLSWELERIDHRAFKALYIDILSAAILLQNTFWIIRFWRKTVKLFDDIIRKIIS